MIPYLLSVYRPTVSECVASYSRIAEPARGISVAHESLSIFLFEASLWEAEDREVGQDAELISEAEHTRRNGGCLHQDVIQAEAQWQELGHRRR